MNGTRKHIEQVNLLANNNNKNKRKLRVDFEICYECNVSYTGEMYIVNKLSRPKKTHTHTCDKTNQYTIAELKSSQILKEKGESLNEPPRNRKEEREKKIVGASKRNLSEKDPKARFIGQRLSI